MNKMNRISTPVIAAVLSAIALSLSSCGTGGNNAAAPTEAPLAGAKVGGPFTLTNQDGKPVHWSDFKGKYRIVYFGYTYCPDVCPVDLQAIMAGYRLFAKQAPDRAAKIQPIFISVDPERDTPAVIKPWIAAFDPHLIGLTGSPDAIAKVAKEFAVAYSKEPNAANPGAYLVGHSRTPFLFGPNAEPIDLLPIEDPATTVAEGSPEAVAAFLDHWVK